MFKKIKDALKVKKNPLPDSEIKDTDKATKGMALGCFARIDYPLLELSSGIKFSLGDKSKLVTGVSTNAEAGNNSCRFYTQDDYFIQTEYFGEDRHDNLTGLFIAQYVDGGESLNNASDDKVSYWRDVVENAKSFDYEGVQYERTVDSVLGGLEVVELECDEVNTLQNNYAIFSRNLGNGIEELLIVNVEQEADIDDDGDIIDFTSMDVSIAIAVQLSHNCLYVSK